MDRLHDSSDGRILQLPPRGLHRDMDARWRRDARLVDAARVFFGQARGDYRALRVDAGAFAQGDHEHHGPM